MQITITIYRLLLQCWKCRNDWKLSYVRNVYIVRLSLFVIYSKFIMSEFFIHFSLVLQLLKKNTTLNVVSTLFEKGTTLELVCIWSCEQCAATHWQRSESVLKPPHHSRGIQYPIRNLPDRYCCGTSEMPAWLWPRGLENTWKCVESNTVEISYNKCVK